PAVALPHRPAQVLLDQLAHAMPAAQHAVLGEQRESRRRRDVEMHGDAIDELAVVDLRIACAGHRGGQRAVLREPLDSRDQSAPGAGWTSGSSAPNGSSSRGRTVIARYG